MARLLARLVTVFAAAFAALIVFHLIFDEDPTTLEEVLHEHDEDPTTFLH